MKKEKYNKLFKQIYDKYDGRFGDLVDYAVQQKQKIRNLNRKRTIKIYVEGGCVEEVKNLPKNMYYEIIDADIQEEG